MTRAAEVAEEEEEVSEAAVTTEDTAEAAAGVEIEETEATGVREESGEVTVEVEAETEDNMMTAGTTRGRTGHAEGETLVNENLASFNIDILSAVDVAEVTEAEGGPGEAEARTGTVNKLMW